MRASSVCIDAGIEADVGAVVGGDDGAGVVAQVDGLRAGFVPGFGWVGLYLDLLEAVLRVGGGAPADDARAGPIPLVHRLPGTFQGLPVGPFEAFEDDVVGRVEEFDHLFCRDGSVAGEGAPVALVEVAGLPDGRVLFAQEAGEIGVRLERDPRRRFPRVQDGEDLASDLEDPVPFAEGKARRGARLQPAVVSQVFRGRPFLHGALAFVGWIGSGVSLTTDPIPPTGYFSHTGRRKAVGYWADVGADQEISAGGRGEVR